MSLLHRAGKDKHDATLREKYNNMTCDTFVFDSGATSHTRFSKDSMIMKPLKIAIKVGNAEDIYSEAIGTFKGLVTQKDGSTFPITLEDVLYIPELYVNLFSMTRVLKYKTVDFIAMVYDKDHKLLFDKIIEVGRGTLLGVDIVPHQENLHIHIRSYKELHELWDIQMSLSFKQLQRSLILSMILHICHVRTVLVLRLRLKTFQKNLQRFWRKRKEIELCLI
jgi:hypothetical protein